MHVNYLLMSLLWRMPHFQGGSSTACLSQEADCCHASGLLEQIIQASLQAEVPLAGENALQRYDHYAFDRIAESALGRNARAGHLEQLTFLRMGDLM